MGVVGIAHAVLQAAVGLGAHDLLRFIGVAPAHQRVRHEAGNAQQLAARGQAQHAQVAGVAAAPQAVVGVELARLQVRGIAAARGGARVARRRRAGCGGRRGRLVVGAGGQADAGQADHRGRVQETAAAGARGDFGRRGRLVGHGNSLGCWMQTKPGHRCGDMQIGIDALPSGCSSSAHTLYLPHIKQSATRRSLQFSPHRS